MTKKEIVKAISEELGLTQMQTKMIVQKTFESIIDTLVEDPKHRIELRNFGVFEVKKRAARKARNPRTSEDVYVEEKYVVTFKPGKEMEERVRNLDQTSNTASAVSSEETSAVQNAPEASYSSVQTPAEPSSPPSSVEQPTSSPLNYPANS